MYQVRYFELQVGENPTNMVLNKDNYYFIENRGIGL